MIIIKQSREALLAGSKVAIYFQHNREHQSAHVSFELIINNIEHLFLTGYIAVVPEQLREQLNIYWVINIQEV